jgi:c-di-GMP-binding flagellar brake protein YcgR
VLQVAPAEDSSDVEKGKKFSLYSGVMENAAVKYPGEDKRAFTRMDKSISLYYKVYKSQEELIKKVPVPEEESITKNISAGGLLFTSDKALAVGSILDLKMELPDGEGTIHCLAKVVRTEETEEGRSYDIGICFLDIASSHRARINRYIQSKEG